MATYNGKEKSLRYINIDAKAGDPNTFWVGASGRYYRTYADALKDDASKAVDPTKYVATKTFWQQHKKTLLICALILAAGLAVVYLFDINKLVYDNKPW